MLIFNLLRAPARRIPPFSLLPLCCAGTNRRTTVVSHTARLSRVARKAIQALFAAGTLGLAVGFAPAQARAQMAIEITGVGSQQFPIAVANFQTDAQLSEDVAGIIRADLTRSGLFRLLYAGAAPIDELAHVDLADWKSRGADDLAVGSAVRLADNQIEIRYRLYDAVKGTQVDALAFASSGNDLRRIAHKIADRIYETITGYKGVFSTRIAYVVQFGPNHYELQVADADGANPQTALKSREFIISPTWSADGNSLAYVSFEGRKAAVYVHSLATGQRHVVANFPGSNSGPAFSPDGNTLAAVLTRDGNSEIYTMSLDGSNLRRLTYDPSIDTEPVYSPDGAYIYFTSDRSGGPQIYRMPAAGGSAQRITFVGDYNISPRVSPDGKSLAFVSRRADQFRIEVLDLASSQELTITDTVKDESPSFAPNGRLVLYATEIGGRGILALASTDGRARARLSGPNGDVREPSWGPFSK
jgi:TolB protein